MSEDNSEFREAIRECIHRHDVDADDLRAVATDLHETADKWESIEL